MSLTDRSRIFVTGGTGVLGRPVVRLLVSVGHDVRVLSRSDDNDAAIRRMGAHPVRGDLFDAGRLGDAIGPGDAVLHLATRVPPMAEMSRAGAWSENDRIRAEGTRIVVDRALAAGVETIVYPGINLFYPDRGDTWIEMEEPDAVPGMMRSSLLAEREIHRFAASGRRGIVLRMASFYSTTAPNTLDAIAMARRGLAPVIGRRDAFVSQVWVDDAAAAVVAALGEAPGGTYDVADDEPVTRGEILDLIARAVGRRRLLRLPLWLVRLVAGREALFAARSQRISNRRFREATGWAPEVPSAREGWARIADALRAHEESGV